MYRFGTKFGYTPQQIKELDTETFAMLDWGIDEVDRQTQAQQSGKAMPNPKGGSSADGEKITSVAGLMAAANKR